MCHPDRAETNMAAVLKELSGGEVPNRVICCGHFLEGNLATLGALHAELLLCYVVPCCAALTHIKPCCRATCSAVLCLLVDGKAAFTNGSKASSNCFLCYMTKFAAWEWCHCIPTISCHAHCCRCCLGIPFDLEAQRCLNVGCC